MREMTPDAPAGPAVTSGPAQPDSGSGAVYAPATQIPSGVSPGLNASDSVAGQSGAGAQSGVANSGTNSSNSSSTTTQNPYANAYSNGGATSNTTSASTLTGRSQEKVVEISVKDLAAETTANHEKGEVTKKFEPSILNTGIDQVTKSNGTIPSQPSSGQPGRAPIPNDTIAPQAPAKPQN